MAEPQLTQDQHDDNERTRDLRAETREMIDTMQRDIAITQATLDLHAELAVLHAAITKARYDALIEAEFTESQALTMILQGWG